MQKKIEISFELAIRLLGVIEMFKEKMPHGWHEAIASAFSAGIIDAGIDVGREKCEDENE